MAFKNKKLREVVGLRLTGWLSSSTWRSGICPPVPPGGELGVSNFLLWQIAYSELYFTDLLWPDFDETALHAALDDYRRRQRRFGRTSEQIPSSEASLCSNNAS